MNGMICQGMNGRLEPLAAEFLRRFQKFMPRYGKCLNRMNDYCLVYMSLKHRCFRVILQWSFCFPTFFVSFDYRNCILEAFKPYWSHFR